MSHKPDPKCSPYDLDQLMAFIRARPDIFGKPPSREQRVDFAQGNTRMSNHNVTREMVEKAVDDRLKVCPRLFDAQPWEVVGGEHDLGGES